MPGKLLQIPYFHCLKKFWKSLSGSLLVMHASESLMNSTNKSDEDKFMYLNCKLKQFCT